MFKVCLTHSKVYFNFNFISRHLLCLEFSHLSNDKVFSSFQFLHFVIFLKILRQTGCELPSSLYSQPNQQQQQHFMPTFPPDNFLPPPAIPSTSYGTPDEPSTLYGPPNIESSYGPPNQEYGAPPKQEYGQPSRTLYGPPTQSTAYGPPAQTPAPIIHKHVYVHIPPPEPEYTTPRRPVEALPLQKHYRIIFIKAPTHPAPTAPPLPPASENQEKTIVYVLVKKPDDVPNIVLPTPASTIPSKPEVYFIRYKTQESTTQGPEILSESGGYYRK